MKSENNSINRIFVMVLAVILTMIYFFAGHKINYATDTFATFVEGYKDTTIHMAFDNGRLVTAAFYWLFAECNIGVDVTFYILYWGGMICLTLAIYELVLCTYKYLGRKAFLVAIVLLINVFIIDYYLFLEALGFCMGILFSVLAAKYFLLRMENDDIKFLYISTLFLALGILCYQAVIGAFVAIILPFVIRNSQRNWNKLIRYNVEAFVEYAIVNAAAFLMMSLAFHSDRVELMGDTLGESIAIAWNGIKEILIYTDGILDVVWPTGTWGIVLVLMIIMALMKALVSGTVEDRKWNLAYVLYIVGVIVLLQFVLYIIGRAVARVSYPLGMLPGALLMYILMGDIKPDSNKHDSDKKVIYILRITAVALMGVYMIAEAVAFLEIFSQRYESNRLDKEEVIAIGTEIDRYEQETGNKINAIAFYYDADSDTYWDCVTYYSDTSVRALSRKWSHYTSVNYYLGREYYSVEPYDDMKEHFATEDWQEFAPEQVICDGSTAHVCVY